MKLYTQSQINELIADLTKCFLSHNMECYGQRCTGCWKDIVRSTIEKALTLKPIELPTDDMISKMSIILKDDYVDGIKWVIDKIKNQQ